MIYYTKRLLILLLFAWSSLVAETLHVFVVGDTRSNLTAQVQNDLKLIDREVKSLAKVLKVSLKKRLLKDERASSDHVREEILQADIQPDDLVFFYFSGHGFRTENKQSPWPYLYFSAHHHSMDIDEIAQVIAKKRPHFALIVADCCNNIFVPGKPLPPRTEFSFATLQRRCLSPEIRALFANSTGILIMSGAQPGGFAWTTDEGGILTCAIFDALSDRRFSKSSDWQDVIDDIKSHTRGIQQPVFSLQ